MVELSDYENRIMDGEAGKLNQVAMQNIVRYAEILGAQSLCEVTKATVFCGAHHYLGACKSEDFDVVFSRMNMVSDEILNFDTTYDNCYIQSCVSPCDHHAYKPFGQTKAFFEKGQDPCKLIKNGDWVKMNGETGQVEISRPQHGGDNPLNGP